MPAADVPQASYPGTVASNFQLADSPFQLLDAGMGAKVVAVHQTKVVQVITIVAIGVAAIIAVVSLPVTLPGGVAAAGAAAIGYSAIAAIADQTRHKKK